jgi:hypothetical protein
MSRINVTRRSIAAPLVMMVVVMVMMVAPPVTMVMVMMMAPEVAMVMMVMVVVIILRDVEAAVLVLGRDPRIIGLQGGHRVGHRLKKLGKGFCGQRRCGRRGCRGRGNSYA